jgi:hypothetical protein
MLLNNTSAAFIGAAVTLILAILFFIFLAIMIKLCLKYLYQRRMIQAQRAEVQARRQQARQQPPEAPVPPTFDWHHSIKIQGSPPPTYEEAKDLPSIKPNEDVDVKSNDNVSIKTCEDKNIEDDNCDEVMVKENEGASERNNRENNETTTRTSSNHVQVPLNGVPNSQDSSTYYLWTDNQDAN